MVIRIDQMDPIPIYLQIRSQIIALIAKGELQAGEPLPSVRNLAASLGVNLHTVNKAYAVLRDEGYVAMRGRSGAVVTDYTARASADRQAADADRLASDLLRLAVEFKARGGTAGEFVRMAQDAAGLAECP